MTTQTKQAHKPSISAEAGIYFGKPAIIVIVESGNDDPICVMTYGESEQCDEKLYVGNAKATRNISIRGSEVSCGLLHGAGELVSLAGLQPWPGIEEEFAQRWNVAALQFNGGPTLH